ncbi:dihydropteroate synthase [Cellvibrio sp. KY-YJ-3]|jgi:dihydropteroate synthase|uniref:dihydropteroate synthase n=1 Tax=Cellvibrio sp. KY-YJ-3 TaxID=454662 RepID=UPI0012469017|nr:dihydropteroate synthase [Cellvibrio sp. KY-YJ-3]QEY13828.1 dihydropteroate synthase [Cellvibrio sp. KY-YJ-3]
MKPIFPSVTSLCCGKHLLDLTRPVVMGILNATPDSFSDGGSYYKNHRLSLDLALRGAEQMLLDGAQIIDVGGESTRPGAPIVSVQEELDRVIPVVEAVVGQLGALVSVDTSSASVIRESASRGASLINDVRALQREGAVAAAAETGLPVCLMHMQGEPDTMQQNPNYSDVVEQVFGFLEARLAVCQAAGIAREQILLDPGFGFGKTLAHNLALLKHLPEFARFGLPLLVGMSRKSMVAQLLGRPVEQRLAGSLALAMLAAERGAAIIRVHDVAETVDVLKVLAAVNQ